MTKKSLHFKMKSQIFGGGLLFLSNISLFSIGYSSWMVSAQSTLTDPIYVSVGDVVEELPNFNGGAFFVKGSEKGFGTFQENDSLLYQTTTFSCQIKIRPDLIKGQTEKIILGLAYEYRTTFDIKAFSNPNIIIPEYIQFKVNNSGNRKLFSGQKKVESNSIGNGKTRNILSYDVLAFDNDTPSLWSLCSEFQTGTSFVVLDVSIDFKFLNDSVVSSFSNIPFYFRTNLKEA